MMLSIFVNHQEQWIMVVIDIDHLWISMHELQKILYSGCVCQIEVRIRFSIFNSINGSIHRTK